MVASITGAFGGHRGARSGECTGRLVGKVRRPVPVTGVAYLCVVVVAPLGWPDVHGPTPLLHRAGVARPTVVLFAMRVLVGRMVGVVCRDCVVGLRSVVATAAYLARRVGLGVFLAGKAYQVVVCGPV